MLAGKTWKFWALVVSGFVFVSCCGLLGLAGAIGSTQDSSGKTVVEQVATAVAPTNTPKPAPTENPIEVCEPQVRNYLSTQAIVSRLLSKSMGLVSEGDLVGGYKEFDRARSAFGATNPPACDDDVIALHDKMAQIISLTERAFTAMSEGDFESSTQYLKDTSPIINQMAGMVESIGRKYD